MIKPFGYAKTSFWIELELANRASREAVQIETAAHPTTWQQMLRTSGYGYNKIAEEKKKNKQTKEDEKKMPVTD